MSNLTVVSCPTAEGAQELSDVLWTAATDGLIEIEDMAIVRRNLEGPPKMWQVVQPDDTSTSLLSGAFWGATLGTLFVLPFTGTATGVVAGLAGAGKDFGIDDDFIERVRDRLEPGTSALFLLAETSDMDTLRDRLLPMDFDIMSTSLDPEREAELREMFHTD